ncbi:hypothetical protein HDU85_004738 [Gaertneriomyces sp. JEL0708]|nr:hypothetical protein HDU85_004738 [Gaertneriomyces sp. JEL0708]
MADSVVPLKARPSFSAFYLESLRTHPLLTKSVTSASLNGLQELLAALFSGQPVDGQKAVYMGLYGFTISAPLGHVLYELLNKIFANKPATAIWSVMKLLASNFGIAPLQNAVYLAAMAIISNPLRPVQAIKHTLGTQFMKVMRMTWIMFPAVQIVAFKYLPQEAWLPFFNLVSFVFGTYINTMTKIALRKSDEDKKRKAEALAMKDMKEL